MAQYDKSTNRVNWNLCTCKKQTKDRGKHPVGTSDSTDEKGNVE